MYFASAMRSPGRAPIARAPRLAWLPLVLAALLGFGPLATTHAADPTPFFNAVAALTDPARLATLTGPRAANDRLHKILAWLEEARRAGIVPSKTLDEAQRLTCDPPPAHAAAVKETLLRNFELCDAPPSSPPTTSPA